MLLTDAIPENDLQLARLTAARLAKVMHGLMSVGTASLELDSPANFLAGRDRTPLGFLEVLGCIGVKPGHTDKLGLLRDRLSGLACSIREFHTLFLALAQWRTMSAEAVAETVNRVGDSYSVFCERLGEFCALLGIEADYSLQARTDRAALEGLFSTQSAR